MQQPFTQSNQTIKNEQEAQDENNKLVQIDLSLEAKVILAFKNKRANKLKLLDQVPRANIDLNNQLTDKTKFLHPIACTVAKRILNKLSRKEVIFTHKELSEITNCLNDQNVRIIKQLGNLLEFKYHQKYLEHNHCYIFKIHTKIIEILENAKLGKGGVL